MEGIFNYEKYGAMLQRLVGTFDKVLAYYFDLPFEETLARHASKLNAHESGEKEMREWWNEKDLSNLPNERILTSNVSVEAILNDIMPLSSASIRFQVANRGKPYYLHIDCFVI